MTRRSLLFGGIGALVLSVLEAAWYYVANVTLVSDAARTSNKTTLEWLGVSVVLIVSCIVATRERERWLLPTGVATAITVTGGGLLLNLQLFMFGIHQTDNSAFLSSGEPAKAVVGIAGILAVTIAAGVFGVVVGGICRWLLRTLGRMPRGAARAPAP